MTENQYGQTPQQPSAEGPSSNYQQVYGAPPAASQQSPSDGAHAASGAVHAQPAAQHAPGASAASAAPARPQGVPAPVPAAEPKPKGKSSSGKTFLIAFAGAAVACVLAFGIAGVAGVFDRSSNEISLGSSVAGSIEASEAEASLAEAVADKCLPSVASINVFSEGSTSSGDPIYDYFYGSNEDGEETASGLGSGVVLSADGYLITNNHVVSGGSRFEVVIEGNSYQADLVGVDSSSDVAVLKVKDVTDLTPIEVADSDALKIGEWVMSIGSPFGLEQSVATGIISATSRSQIMDQSQITGQSDEIVIYPNLIQTDAAINPGNSGGALVNADGQLVGINTLITSYSGNYSGVGFAIPSNYAIGLAKDIIAGKEPTHAQLGVNLSNVNASIAKRYGFSADEGAYVSNVVEGSGAAAAGIEKGDIITAFDGKAVTSASDLMMDVRTKAPGDTVTITVNRDGEVKDFQVTLGSDEATQKEKAAQKLQQQQNNGNSNGGLNGNSDTFDLNDLFGR